MRRFVRSDRPLSRRDVTTARAPSARPDEDGAAAVEFALVSLLFLMLVFGIVTFGLVFALNHTLTHAAAEGARSALVATGGATVQEQVAESAATTRLGWLENSANPPEATVGPCVSDPGRQCVEVVTSYNWLENPLVPPLPGLGLVMPDVMTRSAVVQVTQT